MADTRGIPEIPSRHSRDTYCETSDGDHPRDTLGTHDGIQVIGDSRDALSQRLLYLRVSSLSSWHEKGMVQRRLLGDRPHVDVIIGP